MALQKIISPILLLLALFMLTCHTAFAKPADPLLLANVWKAGKSPADYLVSEKYDGARAIWDGTTLRFRSGRAVNAPTWFLAALPKVKLDGELWMARGKFEALSGAVRRTVPRDDEWREISYMVFELPDHAGSFTERYEALKMLVAGANMPALKVVEQTRGSSEDALRAKLDATMKAGGEGLMLHLADAPYVTGRGDVLLKLKPLDDTEARVVAHVSGRGKYVGMMGALRVEMPDGKRFNIGTGFSDQLRAAPPAIGTTITYTYRGLTNSGLPRFASFLRVREKF